MTLGKHDEDLGEYEIVDGLTKKDSIAFPTDALEEGTKTEEGDLAQTLNSGMEGLSDMDADYQYDDESMNMDDSVDMESYDGASADLEPYTDTYESDSSEADMEDSFSDDSEDVLDPNEDLVPMDEAPGMTADEDTEGIE